MSTKQDSRKRPHAPTDGDGGDGQRPSKQQQLTPDDSSSSVSTSEPASEPASPVLVPPAPEPASRVLQVLPPVSALDPWVEKAPPLYRSWTYRGRGNGLSLTIDERGKMQPVTDPRVVATNEAGTLFVPAKNSDQGPVALYATPLGRKRPVCSGVSNTAFVAARGDFVAVVDPEQQAIVILRLDATKLADAKVSPYVEHTCIKAGPGVSIVRPQGVAFLPDGEHIAVADFATDRVQVFALDGKHKLTIGAGTLNCPLDVACFDNGDVAVADSGNNRVAVFSVATGELLDSLQTPKAMRLASEAGDKPMPFCGMSAEPVAVPGHELFNAVTVLSDGSVAAHDARSKCTFVFARRV